jgi:ubiquinone/menaquinone biosynthesis C-methylase UbiE
LAPNATILGVDRSLGMLHLAKEKHPGPLAQMDVQNLALPADQFDSAVIAFVLFHVPQPTQCLNEVHRVLKAGGTVGSVTWGAEHVPPAHAVWDEELNAVGAQTFELPAVDNRSCCDSEEKMTALFGQAGFVSVKAWREAIEHRWQPEDHFEYQMRGTSLLRLQSLSADDRETCFRRVRQRLAGASEEEYTYRGEVVMATAVKADNAAGVL